MDASLRTRNDGSPAMATACTTRPTPCQYSVVERRWHLFRNHPTRSPALLQRGIADQCDHRIARRIAPVNDPEACGGRFRFDFLRLKGVRITVEDLVRGA